MASSRVFPLIFASLAFAGTASAQLTDADIETRIREGIRQYDSSDFAAARASFEAVLAEQPDHVTAIYELALTHRRLGELDRTLALLDGAFARNLAVTDQIYALSASALDSLGRVDEAVQRFERGIAVFPDSHSLHLNFGITKLMLNDVAVARASFERAITLLPQHPSAHFYVGQIYANDGLRAAAILALGAGIGFDSAPGRRSAAATIIKRLMDDSIGLGEDGVPIVSMPPDYLLPPMTMARFSSAVGMHYAIGYVSQKKAEGDLTYEPYSLAFAMLVTEFAKAEFDTASHFTAGHYLEFYDSMFENGHEHTFAHLILGSLNPDLAQAWVQANGERIAAFQAWTRDRAPARQQP